MRWFPMMIAAFSLFQLSLGSGVAFAQFAELARQVPSSANSIAFVNVEKLMGSPVAKREGWAAKRDTAFGAGLTLLPPDGQYAVLASQVDLEVWTPKWEVAILKLDHEPSFAKIAGMSGGKVDNVVGHEAVALPGDAYVLKVGEMMAAFMSPANRQDVSRWMREVAERKMHGLSPYLTEAFRFANEIGTPVILALDLEDSMPEASLKELLEQPSAKEFVAKNKLDVNRVLSMLVGLRGLTLGITFSDKPFGKVKVDFRDDVRLSAEAAKLALLHALSEHGAMIDEMSDWKPAVIGKQVTLEGTLTANGMRRISSLFDRPPSLKGTEPTPEQQAKSKSQNMAQASQFFFKQVGELLDDLGSERKRNRNYTMAQIGVWMNKYAKKIDQLSVLNVDPELVEYGANVADALRSGYSAIRTGAARSRVRQVNTEMPYNTYSYGSTYGYSYRMGLWGGGVTPYGSYGTVAVPDVRAYQHARTAAKTEERVSSANSARDIMAQVDEATADIRRKMTQKYQVNF